MRRRRVSGFEIHARAVFINIIRIAVFIQIISRSVRVNVINRAVFILISGIGIVINLIAVFIRVRIRPVISGGDIAVQIGIIRLFRRISIRCGFGFLHIVSRRRGIVFLGGGRRRFGVSVSPAVIGVGFVRGGFV